jgi:hypothetical protein
LLASDLEDLDASQRRTIRESAAPTLKRGYVDTYRDLYPDLKLPGSIGYARGNIELLPLCLLYDKVVLMIPPLSRDALERRWGTSMGTVVRLVQAGLVQPIIARPEDYAQAHFEPLIEMSPPSVWSRGQEMLAILGLNWALDAQNFDLPFDEISHNQWLVRKYQNYRTVEPQTVSATIKRELLVNIADLVLFGEQEIITAMSRAPKGSTSAREIGRDLFTLNEVRTYPHLLGFDGTANYSYTPGASDISLGKVLGEQLSQSSTDRRLGEGFKALVQGVGLDYSNLGFETVERFHLDGHAARLRKGIAQFEKEARELSHLAIADEPSMDIVLSAAENLDQLLRATGSELMKISGRKGYDFTTQTTRRILRIGSLGIGAWLGFEVTKSLPGTVGTSLLQDVVMHPLREFLADTAAALRFGPGLATMWKIRSQIRG